MPVHAEIDLDEMEYNEQLKTFHYDCRCGGLGFTVTEDELEEGVDRVYCGTCSLMIKLLYEVNVYNCVIGFRCNN